MEDHHDLYASAKTPMLPWLIANFFPLPFRQATAIDLKQSLSSFAP
jgi:hypothetical protein